MSVLTEAEKAKRRERDAEFLAFARKHRRFERHELMSESSDNSAFWRWLTGDPDEYAHHHRGWKATLILESLCRTPKSRAELIKDVDWKWLTKERVSLLLQLLQDRGFVKYSRELRSWRACVESVDHSGAPTCESGKTLVFGYTLPEQHGDPLIRNIEHAIKRRLNASEITRLYKRMTGEPE